MKQVRSTIAPLATGLIVVGMWELLTHGTGSIPAWMLPAPSQIISHLIAKAPVFLGHTWETSKEFLGGYSGAVIFGIVYGLILSSFRFLREATYPFVIVLGALPAAAFAPLANIWFGYGSLSKMVVAAVIAVFPIITSTVTGVRTIPRETVEAAMLDGASGFVMVWHILLPLAMPSIMIGLRIAWAGAIIGAITSELFGAVKGLGYVIQFGLRMSKTLDIYVAAMLLSTMSLVGYFVLKAVEGRITETMWVQR